MEALIEELKVEIIETLGLDDISPEDIDPDAPLIGEGLGLDSIDTLEFIVMMEKKYGVKVPNITVGREIFASLRTMAQYISTHR